jgi:hypothetical protein
MVLPCFQEHDYQIPIIVINFQVIRLESVEKIAYFSRGCVVFYVFLPPRSLSTSRADSYGHPEHMGQYIKTKFGQFLIDSPKYTSPENDTKFTHIYTFLCCFGVVRDIYSLVGVLYQI